ncbi:hypothetical protein CBR_g48711 [Chara braunii]|uniref:Glycosyl-hydrolase family 116 N-terminal domain-containing protein n=1 Tax=Chara braunii TaxID=69332 RepID=A0A388K4H4_CHABU|nr:hypothetical protein CBR_g48711 [Chara braunii]|eukprot:GBG64962.1 hypothetical protein CBR_g48711 [Chara braunii]
MDGERGRKEEGQIDEEEGRKEEGEREEMDEEEGRKEEGEREEEIGGRSEVLRGGGRKGGRREVQIDDERGERRREGGGGIDGRGRRETGGGRKGGRRREKGRRKEGAASRSYSSVLYPGKKEETSKFVQGLKCNMAKRKIDHGINSWDWGLDGGDSTYHALFPRAWTIYDGEPDPELKICCRQVSPFIPHNYRESCLPSCAFSFQLVNTGSEDAQVTLLFTFANSIGGISHLSGGHFNTPFEENDGVRGVLLHHKPKGVPPISLAIASQHTEHVDVSICPRFTITGHDGQRTAKDMWEEVRQNGFFFKSKDEQKSPSGEGCAIGAAVAAFTVVPPGMSREMVFSLAWDAPIVKFCEGSSYYRYCVSVICHGLQ